MAKEWKDVPFEIKKEDISEEGMFTGYASTFGGKPDSYRDIVVEGAFRETLEKGGRNGTGVMMLWQHQNAQIPGLWVELSEDKKGLRNVGQLALETALGHDVHVLMKLGAVKGESIGYDAVEYEIDEKNRLRYLKSIILWEISLVSFPANTRARITGVKAFEDAQTPRQLEGALREVGLSHEQSKYIVKLCMPSLREADTETSKWKSIVEDIRGAVFMLDQYVPKSMRSATSEDILACLKTMNK